MLILEFLEKYNHAQGVFASTGAGTLSAEDLREFARDISETFGTGNFKGSWIEGAMQAGEYWISGNKIWKTKQGFNSATAPTQANAYWELVLDPPVYTDQQAISAAKTNIGTAAGTFAEGNHGHSLGNGITAGFSENNFTTTEKEKLAGLGTAPSYSPLVLSSNITWSCSGKSADKRTLNITAGVAGDITLTPSGLTNGFSGMVEVTNSDSSSRSLILPVVPIGGFSSSINVPAGKRVILGLEYTGTNQNWLKVTEV